MDKEKLKQREKESLARVDAFMNRWMDRSMKWVSNNTLAVRLWGAVLFLLALWMLMPSE